MIPPKLGAPGASFLGTWETTKLRDMHRKFVVRGLVANPEGLPWSSFRHYSTGVAGTVDSTRIGPPIRRGNQMPEHLRFAKRMAEA
jgi:hypothetical protein